MNGNLAGVIAIGMWSCANLFITFTSGVPPFLLGFLVMMSGGVLIIASALARGEYFYKIWNQPLSIYGLTVGGVGGYVLLAYAAFKIAPPFEVNVLDYTWPLFLVVFSSLMYGEKITAFKALGLALGVAGTMMLLSGKGAGLDLQYLPGYVCMLLGSISFAAYSVATRNVHFPASFMGPSFIVSSLISLAFHFVFEETIMPSGFVVWVSIAMLAIVRFSYALWDLAMKRGDAVLLASLAYLVPLASMSLFVIFGRVPVTSLNGFAALLVILGCLLVNAPKIMALNNRFVR